MCFPKVMFPSFAHFFFVLTSVALDSFSLLCFTQHIIFYLSTCRLLDTKLMASTQPFKVSGPLQC